MSKYPVTWVLWQRNRSHQLFNPQDHKLGWSEAHGKTKGIQKEFQQVGRETDMQQY